MFIGSGHCHRNRLHLSFRILFFRLFGWSIAMNRFDDDHEEEEEEEENDVLLMMIMMRIFCSSSVRKEAVLQEEIVEKFLFVYS